MIFRITDLNVLCRFCFVKSLHSHERHNLSFIAIMIIHDMSAHCKSF